MKKIFKGLVTVIMAMAIMIQPVTCRAQEVAEDGTLLTYELEVGGEYFSLTRGIYLMGGSAYLSVPSTGYVCGSASTFAQTKVSSIGLGMSIQRYNNGSWSTVQQWTASGSNMSTLTSSKTISVTRGYYYRLYASHSAGGEFCWNTTSGIYVA